MDVWSAGERKMLARFWSNYSDICNRSFEVSGWVALPRGGIKDRGEAYIPHRLREEYELWVKEALEFAR